MKHRQLGLLPSCCRFSIDFELLPPACVNSLLEFSGSLFIEGQVNLVLEHQRSPRTRQIVARQRQPTTLVASTDLPLETAFLPCFCRLPARLLHPSRLRWHLGSVCLGRSHIAMVTVGRCVPAVLGFHFAMFLGLQQSCFWVFFHARTPPPPPPALFLLFFTSSLASWASSSPLLPGAPDCPQ